jgi:hypothetical protein
VGEPADQGLVFGQAVGNPAGQGRVDLGLGQADRAGRGLVRQPLEVGAQLARDGQDAELALPCRQGGAEADLRADLLQRVADLGGQQHDGERAKETAGFVDDRHGACLARARAAGDRRVEGALGVVQVRRPDEVKPGRRWLLEHGCLVSGDGVAQGADAGDLDGDRVA